MYTETYLECITYSYIEIQKNEEKSKNKSMLYITLYNIKIYVYNIKSVYLCIICLKSIFKKLNGMVVKLLSF